jgi:hypothetical protein
LADALVERGFVVIAWWFLPAGWGSVFCRLGRS